MDEETVFEFGIAIVIILGIFNYLYAGSTFFAVLVKLIAVVGVLLLLIGLAQYFVNGSKDNVWSGTILIMVIVVLFGGLPYVLTALKYVLAIVLAVLENGLDYLASFA